MDSRGLSELGHFLYPPEQMLVAAQRECRVTGFHKVSVEPHTAGARFTVHMYSIDKPNAICAGGHDQGVCAVSFAEETHSTQKSAVRHSASGKDNMAADGQVAGRINAFGVLDPHFGDALGEFGRVDDEASDHLAMQAAHGCGSKHTFGSTPDAHHRMHAISANGDGYSGREITVANQADTCAGAPDIRDQLTVARPIEHDDGQIRDVAVEAARD